MRRLGAISIGLVILTGALAAIVGCDRDDTRSPTTPPAAPTPPPPAPQTPPKAVQPGGTVSVEFQS